MLVAMVFGLDPSWGMLTGLPLIGFIAGFGWAGFGHDDRGGDEVDREQLRDQRRTRAAVSSSPARSSRSDQLPEWARTLAQLTRCTTASSSCATRSSAGRGAADLVTSPC